ncbi:MAG: hypothetical protein ACRDSZ_11245, partial [Pseudonocardiaceae bacterium]
MSIWPGKRQLRDPGPSPASSDGDEPRVWAIHLSPDDRYLAVINRDNWLSVHRLDGGRLVQEGPARPIFPLSSVTWSASGKLLAFVNHDQKAELLRIPGGTSSIVPGNAKAVAFSPDGSQLAITDMDTLRIHATDASREPRIVEILGVTSTSVSRNPVSVLAFSPDGRWIACTYRMDTVLIWDVAQLEIVTELVGHHNLALDLVWVAPDVLATSSSDGTVRIWHGPDGRELRVLEASTGFEGIAYAPAHEAVVGWTADELVVWSTATWDVRWQGSLPAPAVDHPWGYRPLTVSQRSTLIATLGGPAITDIAFSRGWDAAAGSGPGSVSTYANAKVLLLGDSGVGKSGLALVLAGEDFRPTESTHARRIWRLRAPELDGGQPAQREVLLWDLAGQPGYRIVHQLHLSGANVALVLFDSRSETAPLAGIGYWARALRHAQATRGSSHEPLPTLLVAARTDRGVVGVSHERLAEVVEEFGFRTLLSTSAREGWGIDELHRAALEAIDWSRVPVVTSSVLFAAVKSFVLDQKAGGILLTPLAALHASFLAAPVTGAAAEAAPQARAGRDLLDSEPESGAHEQERLRGVFEGCVARLESAGLVKHLAFGDFVLLQPELLDVYAGAIVNAAREEPDGLGSMLESRVLAVDFHLPKHERITDAQQEKLLVIATLEELTRHEFVLREETEAPSWSSRPPSGATCPAPPSPRATGSSSGSKVRSAISTPRLSCGSAAATASPGAACGSRPPSSRPTRAGAAPCIWCGPTRGAGQSRWDLTPA